MSENLKKNDDLATKAENIKKEALNLADSIINTVSEAFDKCKDTINSNDKQSEDK